MEQLQNIFPEWFIGCSTIIVALVAFVVFWYLLGGLCYSLYHMSEFKNYMKSQSNEG